jgi:hypothetical protein
VDAPPSNLTTITPPPGPHNTGPAQSNPAKTQKEANTMTAGQVIDKMRDKIRLKHYSLATEKSYIDCDVIVRRWEKFTGESAVLAGKEKTFAEMNQAR